MAPSLNIANERDYFMAFFLSKWSYAVAFIVGLSVGWATNGWRLNAIHNNQLEAIATANEQALQTEQQRRVQTEAKVSLLDAQHYQELQHAQETTDKLSSDLRDATQRLRVHVTSTCPTLPAAGSTTSVDHATRTEAELHPDAAASVVQVTGLADQCQIKLTALQDWARVVIRSSNN